MGWLKNTGFAERTKDQILGERPILYRIVRYGVVGVRRLD
jgi:hypothetical protein